VHFRRQRNRRSPNRCLDGEGRGDVVARNKSEEAELTTHFLGLGLFILGAILLGCFSFSRYAPDAPPAWVADRIIAKSFLYRRWSAAARLRIQLVLSLAIGGAAIWIIVGAEHRFDDKKWAYGTLAMLLGYWLKG